VSPARTRGRWRERRADIIKAVLDAWAPHPGRENRLVGLTVRNARKPEESPELVLVPEDAEFSAWAGACRDALGVEDGFAAAIGADGIGISPDCAASDALAHAPLSFIPRDRCGEGPVTGRRVREPGGVLKDSLFPVPLLTVPSPKVECSRPVRQRHSRERICVERANRVIGGLNWMAGCDASDLGGAPSRAQEEVQSRALARAKAVSPPPPDLSGETALRGLLKGRDDYSCSDVKVASFRLDRVALPTDVARCPMLKDIAPADVKGALDNLEQEVLLPDREAQALLDAHGIAPYWDPGLTRSRCRYRQLLVELDRRGLLHWSQQPAEEVGIFFVAKTNGKLRMIVDCRRSNLRFRRPPGVSLCTSETFGRIEIEVDASYDDRDLREVAADPLRSTLPVHLGKADVKDCFYRMRIDPEFSRYFALKGVSPQEAADVWGRAGRSQAGGRAVPTGVPDDTWYPCLAALPMGCTWSLWMAQRTDEHVVSQGCGDKVGGIVHDRSAPLVLSRRDTRPSHYVYVDNLGVIGIAKKSVVDVLDSACGALDRSGLTTHEREESDAMMDMLGVRLDAVRQCTTLTPSRFWKLEKGLEALLRRKRVSGEMLEAVVGHCTFVALLVRHTLSIFHYSYRYIQSMRGCGGRLWASVRAELEAFRDLLPLVESDWSLPWSPVVTATDSSGYGYGECASRWGADVAAEHGRVPERSRYRRKAGAARAHAFSELQGRAAALATKPAFEAGSEKDLGDEWEERPDFPEVPEFLLRPERWTVIRGGRWQRAEDIHLSEARALVSALERAGRTRYGLHQRRLYLCDNMGVTLALVRGRAKQMPLLRLVRRWAAISLARNLRPTVRWIPSERDVADAPSRLRPLDGAGAYALAGDDDRAANEERKDAGIVAGMVKRAQSHARRQKYCGGEEAYVEDAPVQGDVFDCSNIGVRISLADALRGDGPAAPEEPPASASCSSAASAPEERRALSNEDRDEHRRGQPREPTAASCPRHLRSTLHGLVMRRSRNSARPAEAGRYFADLCTGGSGVANSVCERGYQVRLWTNRWGPRHDPARQHVFRRIVHDMHDGNIFGAYLGPVVTESIEGERVANICVRLVEHLEAAGTPYVIAQPVRSPLWERARLQRYLDLSHVRLVEPDLCRYGAQCRVRARLWCSRLDPFGLEGLGWQCAGRSGRCGGGDRKHRQLPGQSPLDLPRALCESLGHRLTEGPRAAYMDRCEI